MRRWVKVLIAVLAALVVLLALNTVVLDRQTKSAEVTVDGAELLRLPGSNLQVLDVGPREGQPIVLLHCFTCAIDWWEQLMPRLERGHRVIAIDLLGHGGSEKPRSGYSIEDQAQLVAQVLGKLGVKDAEVVGHSLGGEVAVALAEQSPELVGGIVIVDTVPDRDYGSLGLLARAAYTPVIGEALWRVKMDWSIRSGLGEAFAPGYDVSDEFVEDVKRMTYSSYDNTHSAFDSYIDESPLDQRLRSLDLPLLVMFGAEDQIADDPREALSAYAAVPGAQTELIQGAGHSPNVEKPARTAGLILRLAREVRAQESKPQGRKTRVETDRRIVARCSTAIVGPGKPAWRMRSTVAGPFGLFGQGRDLSTADKIGTAFVTKIPAILEGHKQVVLRVPAVEQGRVGLIYGPIRFVRAVSRAAVRVTFRPCADKPRTVWPGGLALQDRRPVALEVVVGDAVRRLRLG